MANIIEKEKKTPNIGKVYAIELKNIKPVLLTFNPGIGEDEGVKFLFRLLWDFYR